MALPSSNFVESPSIQNVFRDKDTGLPLAGGIVTWYSDTARAVKKSIYQQVRLPDNTYEFVELNNPVTLSGIGTYADDNGNDINIYTYPYEGSPLDAQRGAIELYYVVVTNADGVLNETREAWPPNVTSSGTVTSFQSPTNELSNPQFSVVSFYPVSGFTFSVSTANQVTNIAPDWDIVTTGTGTVTVSQVAVADKSAPSHPPYAIQISSTGITTLHLRQRLRITSRLLLNSYVSGTFVAQAMTNPPAILSLNYMPSSSSTSTLVETICEGVAITNSYTTISNSQAVLIDITNPDNAPTGYVDIYIDIPPSSNVQISSVQIVAVKNQDSSTAYMQQSNEREIDHLFHYYNLPLQKKPIQSFLCGWDFAMNPAQLGPGFAPQAVGANKSYYTWDQTILFQSIDSAITTSRVAASNILALTSTLATQIGIIQYLSGQEAKRVLNALKNGLSVNIAIGSSVSVNFTVSLWWKATGIGTGMTTNDSLVSGLDTNGFPTVTAGWTEITRTNTPRSTFTSTGSTITDFGFPLYQDSSAYLTGVAFAIVVGSNLVPIANTVIVDSISLVEGNIPTRPAFKTENETLHECQYYFQKSFVAGVTPAQAVGPNMGEFMGLQFNPGGTAGSLGVIVNFTSEMRAIPSVITYNPGAANSFIFNFTSSSSWTAQAAPIQRDQQGFYLVGTTPAGSAAGSVIGVNWTADARLGLIA